MPETLSNYVTNFVDYIKFVGVDTYLHFDTKLQSNLLAATNFINKVTRPRVNEAVAQIRRNQKLQERNTYKGEDLAIAMDAIDKLLEGSEEDFKMIEDSMKDLKGRDKGEAFKSQSSPAHHHYTRTTR
jgi:hypothetical protein